MASKEITQTLIPKQDVFDLVEATIQSELGKSIKIIDLITDEDSTFFKLVI